MLILNLQVMYTISLYGREDVIGVLFNVMIAIAIVQFVIIVCYHIVTYMKVGVIRNKMKLKINKLSACVTNSHLLHIQQIEDEPPRISENQYFELQEPLVGLSY